ncbi:MAG: hypothetical protein V4760_00405, partial [Bdellovibrionota bacterium]
MMTFKALCTVVVVSSAFGSTVHAQARCEAYLASNGAADSLCASNQSSGLIQQRFSDGTLLLNPTVARRNPAADQYKRRINPDLRQRERVATAVRGLIDSMKAQVTGGRPEVTWNPHVRLIMRRLNSINVVYSDEGTCELGFNGSYDSAANVMALCAATSYAPPEAVLTLVAHELGHLADPCGFSPVPPNRNLIRPNAAREFGRSRGDDGVYVNAGVNECALGRCLVPREGPASKTGMSYAGNPYAAESVCL